MQTMRQQFSQQPAIALGKGRSGYALANGRHARLRQVLMIR